MNNHYLNLALIKISGSDADTFLQGQLTNDINDLQITSDVKNNAELQTSDWQFSGYCNPKGRLIALLQLWYEGDDLYAIISADLLESTVKRLRMYVMRSDVKIECIEQASFYGLSEQVLSQQHSAQYNATQADKTLQNLANAIASSKLNDGKASEHSVFFDGQISALKTSNDYLLIDRNGTLQTADSTLFTDKSTWSSVQIKAGLPSVSQASSELFIPQMLNLDLLDGINFKKGCYTGQEIVARMHYLGKLKQRMFICDLVDANNSDTALDPAQLSDNTVGLNIGAPIYTDADLSKNAGTVVLASHNSSKILAVLRLANVAQTHYLSKGIAIKVSDQQAYDIPNDTQQTD